MKKKLHRQTFCVLLAAVILLLSIILPVPAILTRSGVVLLGIFVITIFLWMTVGVTWPAVFCILAMGFLPETKMTTIMTTAFGNPTVAFLIFTFCCSWALEQTQFVRRCAIAFLSLPIAAKKPWVFMLLYFASILVLGSFMSTTVIVVIYLTLNEEFFAVLGLKKGDKAAGMMTMGLIIVSGISGAVTPIAHVFPMMAISMYNAATGGSISFISYMIASIPAGILTMLVMVLIFRFVLKPDISMLRRLDSAKLRATVVPADKKEKITVGVFLSVCVLWILPELTSKLLPTISAYISGLGTVMPPMLGTLALCIAIVDGKPVMDLRKALSSISWLSIFMGASALALGSMLSSPDIGLSAALTDAISPFLSSFAPFLFMAIMVVFTGFLTNVASNMVIVTLACTIAIPIAQSLGGGINTAALCSVIGGASAYAFATPPAMTTVALGTGSGWTTTGDMAKYGFLTLVFACIFIICLSYPIGARIM